MTKPKRIATAILPVLLLAALFVLLLPAEVAAREAAVRDEVSFKSVYNVGETVGIPENELLSDGEYYAADAYVTQPDGSTLQTDLFTVTQAGRHTVEYRALTAGGGLLTKHYTFNGAAGLYEFSGDKSSAVYGPSDRIDATGLNVTLARGETLAFNRVIDLTDSRETDGLLRMIFTPDTPGVCDADNMIIRFTDAYDPSNVVSVIAKRVAGTGALDHWTNFSIFVAAAAEGQRYTGLEQRDKGTTVTYEGAVYSLHANDAYGYPAFVSMTGVPYGETRLEDHPFELDWDYGERKIFSAPSDVNTSRMVTDLDEPLFYSSLWDGFTTGEAYISFEAANYNASETHFTITALNGWDLSATVYVDGNAPVITVDTGIYTADTVPGAVVGLPYKVFPASAVDAEDGAVSVDCFIYYNYSSDMRSLIEIVRAETFTPQFAGEYAIVYTAADRAGNRSSVVLDVTAEETDGVLNVTLGEHESGLTAGFEVQTAPFTVHNATGAVNVGIKAVLRADSSVTYEIPASTRTFVPMYAGVYDIVYTVSDYITSAETSYEVTIAAPAGQVFAEQPLLPRYFIAGFSYTLPEIPAYTLSEAAPEAHPTDILLDEGSGETLLTGAYTPAQAGSVTVIYRPQNGEPLVLSRPVVDVGYYGRLDLTQYFYGEGDKSASDAGVTLSSAETTWFEFVNTLAVYDFSAVFAIDDDAEPEAFSIRLTDSQDPSVELLFTYENGSGGASFSVNGGQAYALGTAYAGGAFTLAFDNAARTVSPSSVITLAVTETLSGAPFAGFPSGKAYARFELTGGGSATVSSLNGQEIGNVTTDLVRPVVFGSTERGERAPGDVVVLTATYAADVLDPDIEFTLQVFAPDNTFVTSEEGVVLDGTAPPQQDYTIRLEQLGYYRAVYTVQDHAGNPNRFTRTFTVVDTTAPVIELTGRYDTTAQTGDRVAVASYTVTDNLDEYCNVYVTVKTPDSRVLYLGSEATLYFEAARPGVYTVSYIAYDSNGNMAVVDYQITVS